jgi:hypothetical protein
MTPKENFNENFHKPISGIFAKKFMGPHCKALLWKYHSIEKLDILSLKILYQSVQICQTPSYIINK